MPRPQSTVRRCAGAALALSAGMLAAGTAHADTPVVHVVPLSPATSVRVPEGPGAASPGVLDRELPASQEFELELPVPGSGIVSGVLYVWPRKDATRCGDLPEEGGRQVHRLGMSGVGSDRDRVLRARVPKLQVAQPYCFAIDVVGALEDFQFDSVARKAARKVLAGILDTGSCPGMDDASRMATPLEQALEGMGLQTNTKAAGEAAMARYISEMQQGQNACSELKSALAKKTDASRQVSVREAQLSSMAARLPPLLWNGPPLAFAESGGRLVSAEQLLEPSWPPEVLQAAADDLRMRAARQSNNGAVLVAWADLLAEGARATGKDGRAPLRQQAKRLAGLPTLELWTGKQLVDSEVVRSNPMLAEAATIKQQLLSRRAVAGLSRELTTAIDTWLAAVDRMAELQRSIALKRDEIERNAEAASSATERLERVLLSAFGSDAVRRHLVVRLATTRSVDTAGHSQTPVAANFASLDAGAALAFPWDGGQRTEWFLPYLGLNIYLVPVDREIPFDQLVGSPTQRILQRVSLTFGFTLTNPSLPGRTVSSVFLDRYPVVAVGFRMSQYTRFVLGGIVYRLADANPAPGTERLRMAPFAGLSLDIDLVHLLSQAKL